MSKAIEPQEVPRWEWYDADNRADARRIDYTFNGYLEYWKIRHRFIKDGDDTSKLEMESCITYQVPPDDYDADKVLSPRRNKAVKVNGTMVAACCVITLYIAIVTLVTLACVFGWG